LYNSLNYLIWWNLIFEERKKIRDGVVKSAKVQHLIQVSTFSLFNIVFVSVDVASDLATAANFWMINQNMMALATLLPVFAPLFARLVKELSFGNFDFTSSW
jgi:hypothetical protein